MTKKSADTAAGTKPSAKEELVLPPLGKLKVVNSKDIGQGAKALTLKLRTMKTETGDEA